jgi:hypothetical protein
LKTKQRKTKKNPFALKERKTNLNEAIMKEETKNRSSKRSMIKENISN